MLEKVSDERRAELIERLGRCRQDEASVEYLQRTVVNEGGLEAAAREMHAYLERAAGLLSEYEPSAYRTALVDLCAYIAERDR